MVLTITGEQRDAIYHEILTDLSGMADVILLLDRSDHGSAREHGRQSAGTDKSTRNHHPTVKPIELMRWLIRLVTPPGGLVLDPFAGSGTTGCAALLEGFGFIGIERDDDYAEIAKARIAWWLKHRGQGPTDAILAAGDVRDQREAHGQLSLLG